MLVHLGTTYLTEIEIFFTESVKKKKLNLVEYYNGTHK